MKNKYLKWLLLISLIGIVLYFGYNSADDKNVSDVQATAVQNSDKSTPLKKGIPQKAYEVLEYIDRHNKAPNGYVGGRHFGNFEGLLPKKNAQNNKKINYREWDINPQIKGKNRGAERLVTGDDRSAYYTSDHYQSFKQIR